MMMIMMVMVIMVDNDGDGDNCVDGVDKRGFNVYEGKSDDDALK